MSGPRIQNDERGITVNKSLAWTILGTMVLAGIWLGTETAGMKAAVQSLGTTQAQRHEETLQVRRDTDTRLRILENSRASDSSEINALRRDLTSFRADMQELKGLLRSVESGLGGRR